MNRNNRNVAPGDIVQLSPELCLNPMFRGCLMTVVEVRTWGVMGYVQALGEKGSPGGQAYYRANFDEFELTHGVAVWVAGSLTEEKSK